MGLDIVPWGLRDLFGNRKEGRYHVLMSLMDAKEFVNEAVHSDSLE